jgi:hypothetical protein
MVPCEQPVLNKQNYAANARLDHKLLSAPSARSCKYRILLLLRSNVGHRSAAGSQRPSNQDLANSAIQTVARGFPHVSGALLKGSGVCWNDIQEYLKNQEVNQINTSVNIKYEYKITAPPRTFQIDIFWWKQGDTSIPILLLVDILSRKAWAYILTKSKKEKRAAVSVKTIQEFKDEVGLIRGLEGDNEFSSAAVNFFCDDNDIRLDTSVAKEEHISNGNKLGIIDRLVRTLRELIEKYFNITGHRTDNIKDVMKTIVDTYNNSSHRTLNNKTPNQVFEDNDDQIARHLNDSLHNQQIYKSVPFNDGDKVKY